MAIAYKAQATGAVYGAAGVATSVGVNIAVGDLIAIGIGTDDSTIYCTGLTDTAGNTYTLRTAIIGGNATLVVAWCVATQANASNIFTATFSAGTASKSINAVAYTIDSGDTVSLDITGFLSSAWQASPWTTSSGNTTGDDEVCIAFYQSSSAKTYSNQEIPAGTAATVLTVASENTTAFYRILTTPTNGINAETDVNTAGAVTAELVTFKSTAAAGGGGVDTAKKRMSATHLLVPSYPMAILPD
jgi:hypothetical protein